MPKGITQEQVNAAADALVAAGEKPTVEKIREALGTGSPNTVTRMLEVWRGTLAQRLQEAMTLPDVPTEVGQAFVEVWRIAVTHAATLAREALAEDQNALFAAQTSLTQERKLWEIALAEAQANVAESTVQRAQADTQLRERQILVDQLEAQRTDLLQQRDRLQGQLDTQHAELQTLRVELATQQDHVRTVEDRTHQQIDQARQENKALQQRLERERREHGKQVAQLTAKHEELRKVARTAEQTAAHHAGHVAALEATVAQWRESREPAKRTTHTVTKRAVKSTGTRSRRRKP
ncbi:DNA-binding protein [Dyella dinghuensis]|uniref:DNA-binding protein n=1 Tax=Dyella dinghuensis TaxID=1920169 RepID=A0A432LUW2_9GAMM|nr:DNA-binding protein [Dyella dinghuensis]RUL65780.1 DNA-binding protein [Dyella dinghuensis]